MKLNLIKTVLLFSVLGSLPAGAQTATNNFSFAVSSVIPDGDPNGLALNRSVSGLNGIITDVTVTLNISGTPGGQAFNGDLYAYLEHNGSFAVLLNRSGVRGGNDFGYADTGYNVTFSTAGAANIHFYQSLQYDLNPSGQLTGLWQPDGRAIDPLSNPSLFDLTSPTSSLDSFNGADPNGNWKLFLVDASSGGENQITGWDMTLATVPEPATWTLFALATITLLAVSRTRRPRPINKDEDAQAMP